MLFKNLERKSRRESRKRTILANGRRRLLQMVSESDTEQRASEDAEPPRGVDCEISRRLERGTKHSI